MNFSCYLKYGLTVNSGQYALDVLQFLVWYFHVLQCGPSFSRRDFRSAPAYSVKNMRSNVVDAVNNAPALCNCTAVP